MSEALLSALSVDDKTSGQAEMCELLNAEVSDVVEEFGLRAEGGEREVPEED